MRQERSIVTGLPHFGHFSSMMPTVGVILSSTRQPQFGHFLDTRRTCFLSAIRGFVNAQSIIIRIVIVVILKSRIAGGTP